jgi:hypothetical protein
LGTVALALSIDVSEEVFCPMDLVGINRNTQTISETDNEDLSSMDG